MKLFPNKVKFKIAQGGAQIGINDVAAGRVTIGDVSRDPLPTDPAGLVFYPIAKYGICVVTNKANTLGNLTPAQVTSIFTGKTRAWSQVPGATATGTIDLISRTSVAGVLTSFQTLLLEGKKVSSLASEESSEGLLAPGGRKRPERDRLHLQLRRDSRRRQLGQLQRRGLQPDDRRLRAVRRHRALLRGDQRQGDGRRVGVHRLDRVIGRGAQDHLEPVDPDQIARG